MGKLTKAEIAKLQAELEEFFAKNRREMPWRQAEADGGFDPYKILVSEVMLQQTQVSRVIPKFEAFIAAFPNVQTLAQAPLSEVLRVWQGLGYNRRAKFLWQDAQKIVNDFGGAFPATSQELQTLPGVGVNTAGAILVYAFNQPAIFIETNIRTVFIHHFFQDQQAVPDKLINELLAQTIDQNSPREFYWALMDYGSYLKDKFGNLARASKHYAKQSTFQGSRRQIRGQVLRLLHDRPRTSRELQTLIADERLADVLRELSAEQLISSSGRRYTLG